MNIRHAIPDDAASIARVHVDSWRSVYPVLVPDNSPAQREYMAQFNCTHMAGHLRKSISTSSEDIYVAEKEGEIVAFLAIGPCRDFDLNQETTGEIYALYVVPEYWRKGIGRSMCRRAEQIFKSLSYSQVVLWVFQDNVAAVQFYRAMEFRADGVTKVLMRGSPPACHALQQDH